MDTYQEKTAFLQQEICNHLIALVEKYGTESEFTDDKVLNIEDLNDNLCYNLDDYRNAYLSEITLSGELIDNNGNSYNMSVLDLHQLAELADVLPDYILHQRVMQINEAKEAFAQWCDDDAQDEINLYENETGHSFNPSLADDEHFYLWLYERGIRM